jgi:hypothetical protein
MCIGSNLTMPKPYMSHTILITILNPKFQKKIQNLGDFNQWRPNPTVIHETKWGEG